MHVLSARDATTLRFSFISNVVTGYRYLVIFERFTMNVSYLNNWWRKNYRVFCVYLFLFLKAPRFIHVRTSQYPKRKPLKVQIPK